MKIFGIGLSRTGTTSLTKALEILGYDVIHRCLFCHYHDEIDYEMYDAVIGSEIAESYQELDQLYPDSKFILTIRRANDWFDSVIRMEPDMIKENLRIHQQEVFGYFQDDLDRVLPLDICGNTNLANWSLLCRFLDKEIPEEEFPIENVGSITTRSP